MRRAIAILATILVTLSLAHAVRGIGLPTVIRQADGTWITIIVQGDEYSRYTTTIDGYQIAQRDGIYYYWQDDQASKGGQGLVKANDPSDRSVVERDALRGRAVGKISDSGYSGVTKAGTFISQPASRAAGVQPKYVLVILAQFTDIKFQSSSDRSSFDYMLNKAPKSAQQYFSDNSMGAYVPTFDVSPIVTLPRNRAYYGANSFNDAMGSEFDGHPDDMIKDACRLAAEQMGSFSKYDSNSDGIVDNVFVLFAGHNEAEGGPEDAIWPHQSTLIGMPSFGGSRISSYICGSELRGAAGTDRAGVGTLCHEFCHVLGLPDFYDTDYEKNGKSAGLYNLSIMGSGNYNDRGDTPPYMNGYERSLLNWNVLNKLEIGQVKSIEPIQKENHAYYFTSKVSADEFYVIEYRNSSLGLWDKPLGTAYHGMLIYHVDRSNNESGGGVKASARWINNTVNEYASHPCMRIATSTDASEDVKTLDVSTLLFPGSGAQSTFTGMHKYGIDWRGNPIMLELIDIKENGSTMSFTTRNSQGTGQVMSFNTAQREVEVIFSTVALADRFTIRYKNSQSVSTSDWKSVEVAANENRANIYNLSPDTRYDVELFAVVGSKSTSIAKSQFVTMLISAPFPAMDRIKTSYLVGENLQLSVINVNEPYTSASFNLNGEVLTDRQYKLTQKGTFTLNCTINYSDQDVEVITRKIIVK